MQISPSELTTYASNYRNLFGDQRLFDGFLGTLQGILGSRSLHLSKIANTVLEKAAPVLALQQHLLGQNALGWESVRLMSSEPLRTLVAFAWLGAAFLYDLDSDSENQGVQFLAQLGGAKAGGKKPGMRTLATGLRHTCLLSPGCHLCASAWG